MNNDLISRSALIERLKFKMQTDDTFNKTKSCGLQSAIAQADKAPAVDAVEVVRCKDCKFQGDEDDCPLLSLSAYTEPDDFCSYGERKDKE